MYSGTTFRDRSGRRIGVHQRLDREARRLLRASLPSEINFPASKSILHFEGKNGPDGIKRKSPAQDEPWHYIDPTKPKASELLTIIDDHLANLSVALADRNKERAAFEAAWLAHAVVDGLTPPHHYPLEEKLAELRGGQGLDSRTSVRQKVVMPGKTVREKFKNNWQYWGKKGVMTSHILFELGVATTISGIKLNYTTPTGDELKQVEQEGFRECFLEALQLVNELNMYEDFMKHGWTKGLVITTRRDLVPTIVRTIDLAWYSAAVEACKKRQANK